MGLQGFTGVQVYKAKMLIAILSQVSTHIKPCEALKMPLLLHLKSLLFRPNFQHHFVLHRMCGFRLGKGAELF
jgi:hypothetical protein